MSQKLIFTMLSDKVLYSDKASGNIASSMTASWMISGLVLKYRKDTGVGMAQTLISSTLSGKAVYSDSAGPPHFSKRVEISHTASPQVG